MCSGVVEIPAKMFFGQQEIVAALGISGSGWWP